MNIWAKAAAAATVVAALAAVAALAWPDSDPASKSQNTNVTNQGSGDVCIVQEGTCHPKPPEQLHEERVLADFEANKAKEPWPTGPWPFVVARDANIGLKVRTTNTLNGVQIGGLAHLHTAWVVCKQNSGFDPEGLGDLWYQLKWANQQPTTEFFESDAGAPGVGWAHSYYLIPTNHNGNVPDC